MGGLLVRLELSEVNITCNTTKVIQNRVSLFLRRPTAAINPTYSLPPSASPSSSKYQHHPQSDPSHSQWNWTASSVSPTLQISPLPENQYMNTYRQAPASPYGPYEVPQVYTHAPSFVPSQPSSQPMLVPHQSMATTTSPQMPTSMAFQDTNLGHRYVRYGAQGDIPYRY